MHLCIEHRITCLVGTNIPSHKQKPGVSDWRRHLTYRSFLNSSALPCFTPTPAGCCGGNQAYTITPDSGYLIDDVIIDGLSQRAISAYTFTNVLENHTIHATFVLSNQNCAISGYIANLTTGAGVPGIRVDIWDDARTTILRSGISHAGGFVINYPRTSSAIVLISTVRSGDVVHYWSGFTRTRVI